MSTHVPGSNEPEYLGTGSRSDSAGPQRGRRTGLIAAAAVAVVAAVAAGSYGVLQLMSGGSAPATAVPADALAYVSLDLDPSASQKIEAFRLLRKFPAIKEELGSGDDVRKALFDQYREDSDCPGLDYARDVEPWIGNRIALAAVPDPEKGAVPLVVLQVGDEAKAKAGFSKLTTCDDADASGGVSFVGDYMLLAETQRQADGMAADAERATLADSAAFTTAMARAGDPGIVSMYVSEDAPQAFVTAQKKAQDDVSGMGTVGPEQIGEVFRDFDGAAGVLRFEDGAVEAEFAASGMPSKIGDEATQVGSLPATTAVALSFALPDGWTEDYLDLMGQTLPDGESVDGMLREAEQATGLRLPEDLETLLGDGISLSVDGGADLKALTESPDPTRVPAGIRIQGDPDEIAPVIAKLKKAVGPDADLVKVGTGDGTVAVSLDGRYVDTLLGNGGLGSVAAFSDVVPDADRASGVFYLNFDAGDGWAEQLGDLLSDGDAEVMQNIAPLDALGISGWQDDDQVQHSLLRLTTD
jgi:hypothetical protein